MGGGGKQFYGSAIPHLPRMYGYSVYSFHGISPYILFVGKSVSNDNFTCIFFVLDFNQHAEVFRIHSFFVKEHGDCSVHFTIVL